MGAWMLSLLDALVVFVRSCHSCRLLQQLVGACLLVAGEGNHAADRALSRHVKDDVAEHAAAAAAAAG
jgi:hypothetical protein